MSIRTAWSISSARHVCASWAPLLVVSLWIWSATCAVAQQEKQLKDAQSQPQTELFIYGAPFVEPLRDVPQSATVVEEETLTIKGETSIDYELESIPGVSWSGGTTRPRFFIFRGVGELEQYEGAPNPSVATIIDGIDFSGLGIVTPLFDIEQVEVLRGPQGIRFGSSALAGVMNVESNDPTPYTSGTVQVMAGNDELASGGVAIGGAVPGTNEKLQLRFSAFNTQSNGFRDNAFLGTDDTNRRDESVARLKLRYQASGTLWFDWSAWTAQANNGYDAFAIDNSLTTQSDRPGEDDTSVGATSFKVTSKLSDTVKFESISVLARTEQEYSFDGDWGNNPFWEPYAPYDYFSDTGRTRRVLSEELRLSNDDPAYVHGESWRWLGGLFAQRLTEQTSTTELANNEVYDFISSDYRANTGAIFGQVEAPLRTGTSFVTGLRVEQRNARYDDTRDAHFSPDYTMLGGAATLQHDLSERVRGYLTASRGFKGGGFNPGPSVPESRRQYDPEYLWNFETGVKGQFFDKRLETNVAVFHNLRRDQQLKFAIQDDPSDPLSFTYVTDSSGRGQSTGLEVEGNYRLLPWWNLFGSGTLMDTEFTSVPEESAALDGRDFSYAPRWQYSIGTRADLGAGFFVRTEVTGRDSYYFDDSHDQRSDPYSLLNASVGWRKDRWSVTAWGRNLGNESYALRGFYFGNEPPDFPNKLYIQRGDPRAFGITVSYVF
jgi:iron complex outermembrane receptor protein